MTFLTPLPTLAAIMTVMFLSRNAIAQTVVTKETTEDTKDGPASGSTEGVTRAPATKPLVRLSLFGTFVHCPEIVGIGPGFSLDVGRYLQVGASAGGFVIGFISDGQASGSWVAATVGLRFLRTDDSNNSSGVGSVLLETGIGRFDHATDQEDGGDSYRKTLGIPVLLTAELNWRGTGRGGFALRTSTGVLAALSHNIYDGDHHSWERYEVASLTTVSAGYAF